MQRSAARIRPGLKLLLALVLLAGAVALAPAAPAYAVECQKGQLSTSCPLQLANGTIVQVTICCTPPETPICFQVGEPGGGYTPMGGGCLGES